MITTTGGDIRHDAEGEGSRGGHIIGHTKSGKPVYGPGHSAYTKHGGMTGGSYKKQRDHFNRHYRGYTPAEHEEAKDMHEMLALRGGSDTKAHRAAADFHAPRSAVKGFDY